MSKKILAGAFVCLLLITGAASPVLAWFNGAETSISTEVSTSRESTQNNTDSRDYSLEDSYNTDNRMDNSLEDSHDYFESTGGSKRINSSDYNIVGNIRNSNLGNFNQLYYGSDFRNGVTGNYNNIDTSSVNITTFGDSISR
jgi:hypothetical protein